MRKTFSLNLRTYVLIDEQKNTIDRGSMLNEVLNTADSSDERRITGRSFFTAIITKIFLQLPPSTLLPVPASRWSAFSYCINKILSIGVVPRNSYSCWGQKSHLFSKKKETREAHLLFYFPQYFHVWRWFLSFFATLHIFACFVLFRFVLLQKIKLNNTIFYYSPNNCVPR